MNAFCQDFTNTGESKKINLGSPAPFSGVLLRDEAFRFYVKEAERAQFQEEHLSRLAHEVEYYKTDAVSVGTVTAFILGGLTVYFIKR